MKKLFLFLFFFAFTFSFAAITPKTPEIDTDGYYLISSAEELWGLAQMVNDRAEADSAKKFNVKLTKDIVINKNVLNDRDTLSKDTSAYECWPSIGHYSTVYHGEFDGQGHTISGIVEYRYGSMFERFSAGTIKNLNIKDSYFFGKVEMGALISKGWNVDMENVTVHARVVSKYKDEIGGFIGNGSHGTFKNCVFKGVVSSIDTSSSGMGGIAGAADIIFINCENQGRVEGKNAVGGIAGFSYGAILESRNSGVIKGTKRVGGIIGQNYSRLAFCSNTGPVIASGAASQDVGGIVGSNNGYVIGASNTADIQGGTEVGGVVGESTTLISGSYNTGSVTGTKYVGGILGAGSGSMRGNYFGVSSCFNMGHIKGNSYVGSLMGNLYGIYNSVALNGTATLLVGDKSGATADGDTLGGEFVASSAFTDGSVLKILDSKRGSTIWIQGKDYPEHQTVSDPEKKKNYYEISNASQLLWLSYVVYEGASDKNTKVILTDDIVFHKDLVKSVKAQGASRPNYEEWQPIYNNATKYGDGFEGTFDGQGHTISGLFIYYEERYNDYDFGDSLGLFRELEYTANVRNVGVEDSYLRGLYIIGGIAGVSHGSIVNAHFSGYIEGFGGVGGIAGLNDYYSSIRDSYNEGELIAGTGVGGVAGTSVGTITRSYNVGSIKAVRPKSNFTTSVAGGISANASYISNCYNWGPVNFYDYGGGIASNGTTNIENSYNVGKVFKSDKHSYKLNIYDSLGTNNYILKDTTSEEPIVGRNFKEKTAEEFADGSVVDLLNSGAGYDMWIQGDKYPILDKPTNPTIKDGEILISNAAELYWFMEYVNDGLSNKNTKAKLVNDIVIRNQWTPIGYTRSEGYEGEFDGQGHSISGVNVFEDDTSKMVVGFFSKLSETALVKNLTLKDASVKGGRHVAGGIVGNNFGRVENCIYEGSVEAKNYWRTGLIAGYDGGALFGNIGICTSNCDSILVRSDTIRYQPLDIKRKEVANFVIKASEKDDKKFKDGTFTLEANDGLKDVVWKQGKEFPYLGVKIPEFKDGAYQISNLGQLFWAFNYVNMPSAKPTTLTTDIVVNKNVQKSDCATSGTNCNFSNSVGIKKLKSTFDGNGHKISGLYGAFFVDSIYPSGNLNNLKIEDSYFNSTIYHNQGTVSKCTLDVKFGKEIAGALRPDYTSSLVAHNVGTIRDVSVKGSFVNKNSLTRGVGGIAGLNFRQIINVHFEGTLESDSTVGGIVGSNEGFIDSAVFEGSVKAPKNVGGIAGLSEFTITNSVSKGTVVGSMNVGGIVGMVDRGSKTQLSNSYNASTVKGSKSVGGLVGFMFALNDTISDCFNIGSVIGENQNGGGLIGKMIGGKIFYSFNYATDKNLSIGLIADSIYDKASIKHSYAFYNGEAPLTHKVERKDYLEDVSTKTANEFANGTVLELLTKGRSSYRWVQGEKYPVFGKMTVKQVAIPKDSHNFKISKIASGTLFDMNVQSRKIQVSNASVGVDFALLDLQGRVIVRGNTKLKDFEIHVPHAGSYLLKVGKDSRQVNVK